MRIRIRMEDEDGGVGARGLKRERAGPGSRQARIRSGRDETGVEVSRCQALPRPGLWEI